MSRSAARARAGRDRTSLYQEITDKIIAELEAGRVPWVQPWGTVQAKASLAMPRNATTHRQYSGINVLILWSAVIEHGFSGQNWLTFRQALGLGGNVRKGEHGTTVSMPTALCLMRSDSERSAMATSPMQSHS
jgi:antirestriction protein ArdC